MFLFNCVYLYDCLYAPTKQALTSKKYSLVKNTSRETETCYQDLDIHVHFQTYQSATKCDRFFWN